MPSLYTLLLALALLMIPVAYTHTVSSCCARATSETCRTFCHEQGITMDHPHPALEPYLLEEMPSRCPPLTDGSFWNCLNKTIEWDAGEQDAPGRHCCSLSPVHRCQAACLKAKQLPESLLADECRKSDNVQFFQCLALIREGEDCCNLSADAQCRKSCLSVYGAAATSVSGGGINATVRQEATAACSQTPNVLHCAKKLLKPQRMVVNTPTLACCDKGGSFTCRDMCRSALKAGEPDAIDIVEKHCGAVSLTEPLWECFMRKSPPSDLYVGGNNANDIKQTNGRQRSLQHPSTMTTPLLQSQPHRNSYDAAKMSCCERGKGHCRNLCRTAFTSEFFAEAEELDNCIGQPSEVQVAQCLEDVDEPCQPGCSNLSFCSNFNNRPLELFRSCNPEADAAAQNTFQEWIRQSRVVLPDLTGRQDVKLFGPSTCMASHWKALACVLQFRPCKRNMYAKTAICRKDCLKLLSGCMTQYNATLTVEMCKRLTPDVGTGSCVSLDDYLTPQAKTVAVVAPCRYNTCRLDQVCVVDHNSSDGYSCLSGCKYGDRSRMVGSPKSWIQMPVPSSTCPSSNCNEVCYCNAKGELQQCHTPPPQPHESCWVDQQQFEHGTKLQNGCNHCVCHHGELVCTRYRCDNATGNIILSCPLQPNPVCSTSAKRYLNTCVSQWQGTVEPLESCPYDGDGLFAPECYTVIQLVYSQKQIDRLSRSTNKSTIFSASMVEQSLRHLLAYSHCHVSVFHSVDGELLAVVHSSHQMNCASCSVEAEKLVLLFENRSPQVTLNVQLDVILLAEILQFVQLHPSDSGRSIANVAARQVQSAYVIPLFLTLMRFI